MGFVDHFMPILVDSLVRDHCPLKQRLSILRSRFVVVGASHREKLASSSSPTRTSTTDSVGSHQRALSRSLRGRHVNACSSIAASQCNDSKSGTFGRGSVGACGRAEAGLMLTGQASKEGQVELTVKPP